MPNDEQTSLHKASMKNDCSYITEKTVTSEDLLNTYLGNTPLLWGVASSSVSFVLALLDLPDTTHVNVKSTSGNHLNTPLILSVSKGWTHVSTQGKDTKSQMHIATKLLQKGAEVNGIDVYGRTALHYACLHRNFEAISVLVKAGAAWNIKDKNSQTPLDFCCMSCKTALNILQIATGGVENYTYTLVKNNFHSSDTFYQSLSDLLAKDGQFIDVQLLKQSYQFNQKIDFALAPIYNHARKLFERDNQNISFERYAKNFMNPVSSPEI